MDLIKKEHVQVYQALRQAGSQADGGLTVRELEQRCDAAHGKKCVDYWNKQLRCLIDLGYARKSGRTVKNSNGSEKVVWVACDPWSEEDAA